ncbi:carbonyl reductase [NADPH] 1-like [Glandiceps talaboti]
MERRVAVVTGSNKGIGFAIVKALCKQFDGDVYLTARDEARGHKAVKDLEGEGLHPKFHQLDITSLESIRRLKKHLEEKHGGLDVLVNNAAIAYDMASTVPFPEQAENSVGCNFFGVLNTCKELFPLLRPHSRVVHIATLLGPKAIKKLSQELHNSFVSPDLTESELISLMEKFVSDTKAGNHQEKGWANSAYGMSKAGVLALMSIQVKELKADPREDILINSCCPGYVKTDMSNNKGGKSPEEGAETPVELALLPPNIGQPNGELLSKMKVTPWGE